MSATSSSGLLARVQGMLAGGQDDAESGSNTERCDGAHGEAGRQHHPGPRRLPRQAGHEQDGEREEGGADHLRRHRMRRAGVRLDGSGTRLARAETLWVFINRRTHALDRVPPELRAAFTLVVDPVL